jgi:ABC-type thiamine transport system ATPase subunit
MFDAPVAEKSSLRWSFDFPYESDPWNVGLIVGPSGSGKSTVMRSVFGMPEPLAWSSPSMIDDFAKGLSVSDISDALGSVGFNTIPAWTRPFSVLSNGEQFRADLARRVLETDGVVVVDEFTSVVDRQVAQIGSHAVQRFVRKRGRQLVAVTCHYDVIDWLQPDWVLDMATRSFTRRLLQRRPAIECTVGRVPRSAWSLFAPFHYMTAELHSSAQCFGLWVGGQLAAFAGVLHRPHQIASNVKGLSRLVTLPDYQGLGLAFALTDRIAAAYRALGFRFRTYPAHPALVRAFDRSKLWRLEKKPGSFYSATSSKSSTGEFGGRPCAVFEYVGPAMDRQTAAALIQSGA